MNTLDYYDQNADTFVAGTASVDFSAVQNKFLDCLKTGAYVLDFGCGSGRDTKYFLEHGCKVDAIDGSEELCIRASRFTGIDVKHMLFQEFVSEEKYDGVWACASLLHVPKTGLADVFARIYTAIKQDAVLYCSFKYGTFEGERNDRYFTDFTENTFQDWIGAHTEFAIRDMWLTGDVRENREDEKWLNVFLNKK